MHSTLEKKLPDQISFSICTPCKFCFELQRNGIVFVPFPHCFPSPGLSPSKTTVGWGCGGFQELEEPQFRGQQKALRWLSSCYLGPRKSLVLGGMKQRGDLHNTRETNQQASPLPAPNNVPCGCHTVTSQVEEEIRIGEIRCWPHLRGSRQHGQGGQVCLLYHLCSQGHLLPLCVHVLWLDNFISTKILA